MGSRRSRPRKQGKRQRLPRYLVVTEGVTEQEYVERLRQRIRNPSSAMPWLIDLLENGPQE